MSLSLTDICALFWGAHSEWRTIEVPTQSPVFRERSWPYLPNEYQPEAGAVLRCGKIEPGYSFQWKAMAEPKLFEELDRKMKEVLAQSPARDLEKNLRALLTGAFSRLELVTREEFDVQREVLARTRAKLEELEAQVADLEKQVTK